ncbi:hypothetical protein KC356_g115 [Hortaea werneckii]|nr:hypothetical protein KC356_g115 [Hortaea werneckii]
MRWKLFPPITVADITLMPVVMHVRGLCVNVISRFIRCLVHGRGRMIVGYAERNGSRKDVFLRIPSDGQTFTLDASGATWPVMLPLLERTFTHIVLGHISFCDEGAFMYYGRDHFHVDGIPLVGNVFSPNAAHCETRALECWVSAPGEIDFNKTENEETTTRR